MKRKGSINEYTENSINTEKKGGSIFLKILSAIFISISVIFFAYIANLGMLPASYLAILALVDILISGLIAIGIGKKHKTIILNIICVLLAIAIICGYGYIYKNLNATMTFIDTMSETVEQTEDYYIITLNNGKFNTIEDIEGKNLHVFSTAEEYEDVKADISSKVNVIYKEDDSLVKLANDIIDFKSYVALVSSSQYEMIKDDITDFDTKTKIIYTATHKIGTSMARLIEENSNLKIEDGKFNVYISGIDTSGKISNVSRSDANILATINTKTNEVLLTSIPRDYYVTLHSKKAKDKLTHSGVYGINETVTTIEDLLDTEINYYVRVNFTTLIKLVDTLGGVDVYSDIAFKTKEGYSFVKGKNSLNGKEALAFSRERKSFEDGDRQRVKNQQKVLEAIMKKILNSKTILTKYTDILNSLSGSFQTNIEQDDISSLVKGQLNNMKMWNISMNSLDGTGTNATTYSAGSQKLYVMLPDETSVSTGKTKIDKTLGM